MGNILQIKASSNDSFHVTLDLNPTEVLWLKGNMDKMHLFSEDSLTTFTRLVQRGKKESTKYFLLPREFRKGIIPSDSVACTMIDSKTKSIFIYAVNKYFS
jgi:hypothetical protein